MSGTQLVASYASPTSTQVFSSELPAATAASAAESTSVEEKTAYLAALRANVSKLQGEVNVFLTQKMQEDSAAASNPASSKEEAKEEEMYGEEDPEKDG